jgi:hypothetical protein
MQNNSGKKRRNPDDKGEQIEMNPKEKNQHQAQKKDQF